MKVNLDKEVWEGWTVRKVIQNNMTMLDMIMTNNSCLAQPFQSKEELKSYLMGNILPAGCRKKSCVNECTKFFAERYNLS